MTIKPQLVVGQILFCVDSGNYSSKPPKTFLVKVEKVGRKYFTIRKPNCTYIESKHELFDWSEVTCYTSTIKLYITEEAYTKEVETEALSIGIQSQLRFGRNSSGIHINLEQLKAMQNILNQGECNEKI